MSDECLGAPLLSLVDPRDSRSRVIDDSMVFALFQLRIMIQGLLDKPSLEDAIIVETIT